MIKNIYFFSFIFLLKKLKIQISHIIMYFYQHSGTYSKVTNFCLTLTIYMYMFLKSPNLEYKITTNKNGPYRLNSF